MNPRSLRHRLEKAAKLLVLVQKQIPDADCLIQEEKGENGHLIVNFESSQTDREKLRALGRALEGRGYSFTEKKSPWLGQTTYTGRAEDKTSILLTTPINKDRLAINDEAPEVSFSFRDK